MLSFRRNVVAANGKGNRGDIIAKIRRGTEHESDDIRHAALEITQGVGERFSRDLAQAAVLEEVLRHYNGELKAGEVRAFMRSKSLDVWDGLYSKRKCRKPEVTTKPDISSEAASAYVDNFFKELERTDDAKIDEVKWEEAEEVRKEPMMETADQVAELIEGLSDRSETLGYGFTGHWNGVIERLEEYETDSNRPMFVKFVKAKSDILGVMWLALIFGLSAGFGPKIVGWIFGI